MEKLVEIAVGIIRDPQKNQIFITQRKANSHLAGCWEFPGGKIEQGESAEQGLVRELAEEVGIEISQPVLLESLTYSYPGKRLKLHFFIVEHWQGEPCGNEGQLSQWQAVEQLEPEQFPEANRSIIATIKSKWH